VVAIGEIATITRASAGASGPIAGRVSTMGSALYVPAYGTSRIPDAAAHASPTRGPRRARTRRSATAVTAATGAQSAGASAVTP
jgi:hypothetical protein